MAKFDFSLIPEDKRPTQKEPPTKEERKQAILETIEKLNECKTKLRSIMAEDDVSIKTDIYMIQTSITSLEFTLQQEKY